MSIQQHSPSTPIALSTSFVPIANLDHFQSLTSSPQSYDRSFHLDQGLWVSFEPGDTRSVSLTAHSPVIGDGYYTIMPRNLGASRWLSLENELQVEQLSKSDNIIVILDASCTKSTSVYAVLRLNMKNGEIRDASSVKLEIRKRRRSHSFPISFDDFGIGALENAASAKIIFFIEARNVPIDLYKMSVFSIPSNAVEIPPALASTLNNAIKEARENVNHAIINAETLTEQKKECIGPTFISENVRIDIDSRDDQSATVHVEADHLHIDLHNSSRSLWKTIELRFSSVMNTGSVVGFLRSNLSASGFLGTHDVRVLLRVYDEAWEKWEDRKDLGQISISELFSNTEAVFDISPFLPDTSNIHNIGFLFFIPNTCYILSVNHLEVYTYDLKL